MSSFPKAAPSFLALLIVTVSGCTGSSAEADAGSTADTGSDGLVDLANDATDAVSPGDTQQPEFPTYEPPPADVAGSKGCTAYCAAVNDACPKLSCTPENECKVHPGQCVASTEAFLKCKAETGSISCGPDGWTIMHNCQEDTTVCPPNAILHATCQGSCGEGTLAGCRCDDSCEVARDCCFDYHLCKNGGGSKGAFHAPLTCAEANQGKGCCGWVLGSAYPYEDVLYKCDGDSVISEQCKICIIDADGNAACSDDEDAFSAEPNCF